jgi:hypothetical protein
VGLLPFANIGVQARGGFQWGSEGQDFDYTVYAANGPAFEVPELVGSPFRSNNISTNTHGKALGARVRLYPLPLEAKLGRLELGASTYDGKWLDGLWFTSWGIDTAYRLNELELRGEYIQTHREMPEGINADNREGWYIQAAYQLSRLPVRYLNRAELVARYSGQNQRALVIGEMVPGNGLRVSPSTAVPHPREVSLGIDYWINPSTVWKLQYDIELPEKGGSLLADDGSLMPLHTPTDRALMTQFAIGF